MDLFFAAAALCALTPSIICQTLSTYTYASKRVSCAGERERTYTLKNDFPLPFRKNRARCQKMIISHNISALFAGHTHIQCTQASFETKWRETKALERFPSHVLIYYAAGAIALAWCAQKSDLATL